MSTADCNSSLRYLKPGSKARIDKYTLGTDLRDDMGRVFRLVVRHLKGAKEATSLSRRSAYAANLD